MSYNEENNGSKADLNFIDDENTFKKSYEKAISLNSWEFTIYQQYINLLLLADDEKTAKVYYNQLLLVNPLFEESFDELVKFWS